MQIKMKHLFGPVPSQRLGVSLGIDPIPLKVCSFNCVYCEVARTTNLTLRRKEYIPADEILQELRDWLAANPGRPDYITFSGSGEPTLNSAIGRMIREIKQLTDVPVAVITNGSTLFMPDVRQDLLPADVVLPSLDAATPRTFRKINHPHPGLTLERVLEGLIRFRREYTGKIWLEILLVRGVNDREEEFEALRQAVEKIQPDRVHITTVTRPPGHGRAQPAAQEAMRRLKEILGPIAELAVSFNARAKTLVAANLDAAVAELLKIRACTLEDMVRALGVPQKQLQAELDKLRRSGALQVFDFRDRVFYRIPADAEQPITKK